MNATKFVLLLFIVVLCAKLDAKKLEEVVKDTELNLSVPKVTTKGVGDELDTTVITDSSNSGTGSVIATQFPDDSTVTLFGSGFTTTGGDANASGDNSAANSRSIAAATGGASGSVSNDGSSGGAGGSSNAESSAGGNTTD